jgi:hypothetical protein
LFAGLGIAAAIASVHDPRWKRLPLCLILSQLIPSQLVLKAYPKTDKLKIRSNNPRKNADEIKPDDGSLSGQIVG